MEQPTLYRFQPEQLNHLANQMPKPTMPKSSEEAAFLLGIQYVLQKLRDGFTVS